MRYKRTTIAVLLLLGNVNATYAQETDVEKLIGKPNPAIQAQIQRVHNALQKPGVDPRDNVDALQEIQALKKLTGDKDELVKQLAIFVATTKSDEDTHVFIAQVILSLLNFSASVPIRVLAPYLDTDNRQLRDFARAWFGSHDMAHTAPPGAPPIKPVNYEDYLEYVEGKVTHKEDIPVPFIEYIYERAPGRALLVFAYANSHGDVTTRLQVISKSIEARQQGIEPQVETGQRLDGGRQARLKERSDLELAEHIINNAIWLNKNGFAERFQKELPEATAELSKLAKHKEWWVRLYVAKIMQRNPELRDAAVMERLGADSNALVRQAANPAKD